MFLTDGYTCTTDVRRSQQVSCYECSMLNVCCQKQLKSVVRGTSLPVRSPEEGAVKDYRCVPASEEDRKQLDVVLEEFNEIALKSDENEVKASAEMCVSLL